jgi:tetratricopeptide (TPR) repeat protein
MNRMNIIFRYCKCYIFHILLFLSIFAITACTTRSVQIKRAENRYEKGQYYASKGEVDKAIVNFEKSMRMARAIDFREGVAHNLNELAIIYSSRREYSKARERLSEALEIYKELNMANWFEDLIEWDTNTGNRLGVGITLYNMALIYHQHLGMKDKATDCFGRALKIFRETGNEKYIQMIQKKVKKE